MIQGKVLISIHHNVPDMAILTQIRLKYQVLYVIKYNWIQIGQLCSPKIVLHWGRDWK